MSERDRKDYYAIKADPVKYRAYLERKRVARLRRQVDRGVETLRKRKWRAANPEKAMAIRRANHAVEYAIKTRGPVRPDRCSECQAIGMVEAHHHRGYAPEHWLDVVWLCVMCHRKADAALEKKRATEFKQKLKELQKFINAPENLGWHGHHDSYLNDAPDMQGKRSEKAPNLRQLDGDRDE